MISYITIGADDIEAAERFYSAFLPELGYRLDWEHGDLSYALPNSHDQVPGPPEIYVKSPFDGQSASAGNGTMVAFQAGTQQQVRDLYAAALAAGGIDEGKPGFRALYGPSFFVCYFRDPQGNKIALFSSNPNEPGKDG